MDNTICNENNYNRYDAIDTATKVIVDYLFDNNEDFWKLLYYIEPNVLPLSQPNLTSSQKASMICVDPYAVNNNVDKNILFQTVIDEAFSTAIPQVRIEIGDIVPIDSYRAYINIDFQIVVPNKQDIFTAPYNSVARRSDAIFRELAKTLNGATITESGFYSKMFMNRASANGSGRKTGSYRQQMNNNYTGRWCIFSVFL
jgi:hypothetical protein